MIEFSFLLELSISVAVLYLFYFVILRRRVLPSLARIYLLAIVPVAVVVSLADLPILPASTVSMDQIEVIDMTTKTADNQSIQMFQISAPPATEPINWIDTIYYSVMMIVGFGLILSIGRRVVEMIKTPKSKDGIRYVNKSKVSAYSFFGALFVNECYRESSDLEKLIVHERCHIAKRHSLDLIYSSLCCVVMWFNPFVWAIVRSLRFEHERQADRAVIESGVRPMEYIDTLLMVEVGFTPVGASSLSYMLTKNRIEMITKQFSRRSAVRVVLALPVVVALLCSFGLSSASAQKSTYGNAPRQYGVFTNVECKGGAFSVPVKYFEQPEEDTSFNFKYFLVKLEPANSAQYLIVKDNYNPVFNGRPTQSDIDRLNQLFETTPYGGNFKVYEPEIAEVMYGPEAKNGAIFVHLYDAELAEQKYFELRTPQDGPDPEFIAPTNRKSVDQVPTFNGRDIDQLREWINQAVAQLKNIEKHGALEVSFTIRTSIPYGGILIKVENVDKKIDVHFEDVVPSLITQLISQAQWTPAIKNGKRVNYGYKMVVKY